MFDAGNNMLKRSILILLLASAAFAQIRYRVDPQPVQTTNGSTPPGAYAPVYAIPGSTIKVCTDAACTITATAYTDATGGTSCPALSPVVWAGRTNCTSVSDGLGNFGFWLDPGQYYYTIRTPKGNTYGPFPLTTSTANLGTYTPAQTGGAARTIQSKLNDTLSVKDFGAVGNGVADDTTAINATITAACSLGGKVFIPPGNYNITSTVNINACHGIELGGPSNDEFTNRGAILQWYGASGGTMLSFYSSEWSRVHDFTLDGRNLAGIGILWTANTTTVPVSRSNQGNILDHVYIVNANQSPGYCLAVIGHTSGGASGDDISQNNFTNNNFTGCLFGLYQNGTQTLSNEYYKNTIHANVTNSAYFASGDVNLVANTFLGNPANGHVWITPTAYNANFNRNLYENTAPTAPNYSFPSNAGPNRPYTTNLIGEKVQWLGVGGKILDFEQSGTVNVIGTYNDVVYGGQKTGIWYFNSGYLPVNAEVNFMGNVLSYNDVVIGLGPKVKARLVDGSATFDNVIEDATGIFNTGVATLTAIDSPFTASMVGYTCWIEKWSSGTASGTLSITGYSDANNVTMSGNAANSSTARYFRCGRTLNTPGSTYVGYTPAIPSGLTADSTQPMMHLRESDQALTVRNAVLREQASVVYLSAASKDDISTAAFSDWMSFTRTGATATGVSIPVPVHLGGTGHQGLATWFEACGTIHYGTMAAYGEQTDTCTPTIDTLTSFSSCVANMPNLPSQLLVSCVSTGSTASVRVFNASATSTVVVDQAAVITYFKWTTP